MLEELKRELELLQAAGRLREFHPRLARTKGYIQIRGRKLVDFTSWDIFNLGQDPKVKRAVQHEIEVEGIGSGAARLSSGTTPAHLSCEQSIARFLGCESSLLFSSINQAILSLVTAVASERDCILVDERVQGPVMDAAYLVNCDTVNFNQDDPDSLAKVIETVRNYRRKFLFIESLSPTTGVVGDLAALLRVATKIAPTVIIDESSALGMIGLRGAGVSEATGSSAHNPIIVSALSRTVGTVGSFIAGTKILTSYIANRSRSMLSENILTPAIAQATEVSLGLLELGATRRERVRIGAARVRSELAALGFTTEGSNLGAIVALGFPSFKSAQEVCDALFSAGFLVEAIPSTAPLTERAHVRLIINEAHQEAEISALLAALAELRRRV